MLPLTFSDPEDYNLVRFDDAIDVFGLAVLKPGKQIKVMLNHSDGTSDEIMTNHTMSEEHIEWFKAGSALNTLNS